MTATILQRPHILLAFTALLSMPVPALGQVVPATTGVPGPEARPLVKSSDQSGPGLDGPAVAEGCPDLLDLGAGDLSGPITEYARAAELAGAAPVRSRLSRRTSDESRLQLCLPADQVPWSRGIRPNLPEMGPTVEVIWPTLTFERHSGYPNDSNNGALWAGRGANAQAVGGIVIHWGSITGAILPSLAYQENLDFETVGTVRPPGYSHSIYPWHPGEIDWPQRFGERSFWTFGSGQSYIRYQNKGLALTASTENLWWGPAQRYPLLLSNTAPGFAHLEVGTARPYDLGFAGLDARVLWGRLIESEHFDYVHQNDLRLLAGFNAVIQPYAVPGLYLGFSRLHVVEMDGLGIHRQVIAPVWGVGGDDGSGSDHPGYRLLGLSGRWVFPESGFEFYGEWATRARWSGPRDFLREPGRGQAFMLGFQHLNSRGRVWVRSYGEIVQLGGAPGLAQDGGARSFYTDSRVRQGHTHRGQLLGAYIGPGSDAQVIGLDLITPWTSAGIFLERVRRDEDAFFAIWTKHYGRDPHDVALRAGFRHSIYLGDFAVGWGVSTEDRRNRNFLRLDGANWEFLRERDVVFQASLGWRPGGVRKTFRPEIISVQ